jgi:hypothetical protein
MTLFLAGLFIVPGVGLLTTGPLQDALSVTDLVNENSIADLPNDPVFRVAIYNETNTTVPDYHVGVTLNDNYTAINTLLTSAGYDVDILTFQNILDYELTTANYDVLVLADNLPRENITNLMKDFWLAGGGVLSMDSALAYLAYGGILYRENETTGDGFSEMWYYNAHENSTIVGSHPVTQNYQEGDILEVDLSVTNKACLRKEKFNQTSVWPQTTVLAEVSNDPDVLRAVAVDAYDRGGRVVHIGIGGGGNEWSPDYNEMIVDAIAWLAPKPKARIAFDMSHQPRLSVDDWDEFSTLTDSIHKYEDLRDLYVSNRYTFDKFVPSASGNFTEARLNQYDMMVITWPDLNYTAAERTALMAWLDAGGGLIALGDRNGMIPAGGHEYLNFLLDDLDMYWGENNTLDDQYAGRSSPTHPSLGSASSLSIGYRNYLYFDGPAAQSVWEYDGNVVVAAQDYGNGRVVMFCDINILDNDYINEQHNKGYALSMANWLSSANASIVVYSDDPYDGGAYRSLPAQVLNQMEIPFFMTRSTEGFNATLNGTWYGADHWDLLILDHCNYFWGSLYDTLYEYLLNDGRALVNTFYVGFLQTHPVWNFMGANYSANWPSNEEANIWDTDHEIFETPINYTSPILNITGGFFGDDGDMVTVLPNATALAGYNATEAANNASIVLRNDGTTLLNTFLLNNLRGDEDGSGYLDGFEIYFDQISFMLDIAPDIDHPADIGYESGSTGNTITWTPTDSNPYGYVTYVDGVLDASGTWDGSAIVINVDGLSLGVHDVKLVVANDDDYIRMDTVLVTVVDTTEPLLSSPSDITFEVNTTGNTLTWTASDPNPSHFVIIMNSTDYDSGVWDGSSVSLNLDSLAIGVYFFTIRLNDTEGHMSEDTVLVTVTEPGGFGLPDWLDTQTLLLIVIGVLALIIIVLACRRRK